MGRAAFLLGSLLASSAAGQRLVTTTLAGKPGDTEGYFNPNSGNADGVGTAASFKFPHGIAMDSRETFALIVSEAGCGLT